MIAQDLLDILVCPADRGPLLLVRRSGGSGNQALYNPRLHRAYRIDDDIPVLLIDESETIGDDEHALLIAQAGPAAPQ
ncbi:MULTISPECIES: Trm112 family protein [unclassified Mycobacterium]|uniref:Trm112 family protein n=1 Tax=unclassified Mycobacterium TaxID=2642494 RepID=UPI000410A09F|nr:MULTISPECIES: Trm112 family protein [unclassified Mycobacterium]